MAQLPASRYLLRAKDLADARYQEPISVADMARAAQVSRAHFSREFRRTFGEAPHQYLLRRRLERAATLLRTTDWTVVRICHAVGWNSLGSFTTSFGRMFQLTPVEYRGAFPPAAQRARVPTCVLKLYGRPPLRTYRDGPCPEHTVMEGTFREDRSAASS